MVLHVSRGFAPDQAAWRDQRVGFGLRQLLSELLFASKRFRLVEGEAGVRAALRAVQERRWGREGAPPAGDDPLPPREWGRRVRADIAAWAVVEDAEVRRSGFFAGPFSRGASTVVVRVQVEAVEVGSGRRFVARGEGSSTYRADAALFQMRRDRVLFDDTLTGRATKTAMGEAVKSLVEQWEGRRR